jgi:hypothetical protein
MTMMKAILLGTALAVTTATIAQAAEDCGNNRWRDAYGHCHWFHNAYGTERGTHHACPTWAHWEAGRCVHS